MVAGSESQSEIESQSRRQRPATSSSPSEEPPLDFAFTESIVSHRTPVLFSTNRGLHLRRPRPWAAAATSPDTTASKYDIQFCDLERWSTRRANTLSLNEEVQEGSQTSTNVSCSRVRSVRFETEKGRSQRSFAVSDR